MIQSHIFILIFQPLEPPSPPARLHMPDIIRLSRSYLSLLSIPRSAVQHFVFHLAAARIALMNSFKDPSNHIVLDAL